MIVLIVFLTLQVTCSSAIEFKCTNPFGNKIEIICGEVYEEREYDYHYHHNNDYEYSDYQIRRISKCNLYKTNQIKNEIEFKKCAAYELPTAALKEIGYSNIYSLNIGNHDEQILQSELFSNLKLLQKLIADHNKLTELPSHIFQRTDLNYLDLSYNEFSKIDSIGLSWATNLETLNMSNNKIHEISEKSFLDLNDLKVLDLSFNNLTELNVAAFGALQKLEYLLLSHINISHIDFGSFSTLKNLVSIDLCDNHLKTIDIELQPIIFMNLNAIKLSSNGIIEINGFEASKLPKLNFLDLRHNSFNCSHLKSILDSIPINNLPQESNSDFKQAYRGLMCEPSPLDQGGKHFQCTRLLGTTDTVIVTCGKYFQRTYDFQDAYNRLHHTPYYRSYYTGFYYEYYSDCEAYKDSGQVKIQFENCSMSGLPTEALSQIGDSLVFSANVSNLEGSALNATYFSELHILEKLIANHNQLRELGENMFVRTKLNYLDLAYNIFTEIETIGRSGASELKTLNISNNRIAKINATSFKGLDRLEVLDLSFNNLTTIGDETFDTLFNLTSLSMANTNLLHIDFGLLSHLENLQSLDISNTKIRIVEIGLHSAIFLKLQKVDMKGSKIEEIDGLTQTVFPYLNQLDLRSNRLNCSHLQSILNSFDSHKLKLKKDPSSKIKKGKSYRGIACGQIVETKSTIPLIEQTKSPQIDYSTLILTSKRTSTPRYEKESTFSSTESNELSSVEHKTDSITEENETITIEETSTKTTTETTTTTATSSTNANITDSVVGSLAAVNDYYKLDAIHETLHIMKIIITFLSITLILTIVYIILYGNQKSISNRLQDAYVIRFGKNLSNNDENDSVMEI